MLTEQGFIDLVTQPYEQTNLEFKAPGPRDSAYLFAQVTRAVLGMAMMIIGGIVSSIGRGGLAGSGVMLNPQRARQDLEPFNRAAGGMINDTVQEIDALKGLGTAREPDQVVKVRCQSCQSLNDETAKFCNQCGKPL